MYSLERLYFINNQPCEFRYFDVTNKMYHFETKDTLQDIVLVSKGHEDKIVDITPPWKD